jgi:thioredoxin 1
VNEPIDRYEREVLVDFRKLQFDEAFSMAGSTHEFTDGNWKTEVLDSQVPVMVDFWAPWCGPCRKLGPMIEKLAGEYQGKVKVGKLNTDENQDTPSSLRVLSIPTVVVFRGGIEVDRVVGVDSENRYRAALDKVSAS